MVNVHILMGKFQHLVDYLQVLGLDADAVVDAAGLSMAQILAAPPEQKAPALHYSRLYKHAVRAMQSIQGAVPWGAGVGTDAFEMMCHAIMGSSSLGEALERAERFSKVIEPVTGNHISLVSENGIAELRYSLLDPNSTTAFVPRGWWRGDSADSVARASGILVWHAFCGWLIGHALETQRVTIGAPAVSDAYAQSLGDALAVTPVFDAQYSSITFSAHALDYRVVQNHDSLQGFLDQTVYQLICIEQRPASAAAAIKGLLGNDFSHGMPTFTDIAERLAMSESSLRRRLIQEETSFQALKDEVRCELARHYLADSGMKLVDVSERLGFTEPSSFGRSFRQWTGMTPKAYRERYGRQDLRHTG